MKVWLTGSAGMLGRAMAEKLFRAETSFTGTDIDLDVTSGRQVMEFAIGHGFTHIINCAAYTDVDGAEAETGRAEAANVEGPANIAQAALQIGASVVHFSTDYVFNGRGTRPYREDDPCDPLNAYGRTKLEGETRLLSIMNADAKSTPRVYVLRTSWLFGEGGRNFVDTMLSLMADRESVKVVADQTGRPTYCADLADAALALLGSAKEGSEKNQSCQAAVVPAGIYHFANSGQTTWHGLATDILRTARKMGFPLRTSRVQPVPTSAFPRPAPRPVYSVLSTDRIESVLGIKPRPWESALAEYLQKIK